MKKQLLALTLISLGYIASSYGMGVAIMAQYGKLKTDVVENTSQTVYARAIWIEDEKPVVTGQPVLELEEVKKDVWLVKHLNPGTATLHVKKSRPGYSDNHEKGHHHCKPAVITVKASKKRKADDSQQETTKSSKKRKQSKDANSTRDEKENKQPVDDENSGSMSKKRKADVSQKSTTSSKARKESDRDRDYSQDDDSDDNDDDSDEDDK